VGWVLAAAWVREERRNKAGAGFEWENGLALGQEWFSPGFDVPLLTMPFLY
jgi:hypothetical protein